MPSPEMGVIRVILLDLRFAKDSHGRSKSFSAAAQEKEEDLKFGRSNLGPQKRSSEVINWICLGGGTPWSCLSHEMAISMNLYFRTDLVCFSPLAVQVCQSLTTSFGSGTPGFGARRCACFLGKKKDKARACRKGQKCFLKHMCQENPEIIDHVSSHDSSANFSA